MNEEAKRILVQIKEEAEKQGKEAIAAAKKNGESLSEFEKALEKTLERIERVESAMNQATGSKYNVFSNRDDSEEFLGWFQKAIDPKFPEQVKMAKLEKKDVDDAMSTIVAADGAVMVPTQFIPKIVRLIESYSTVRQDATLIPMKSKTVELPALTAGIIVYFPGEKKTIPKTKPEFELLTMIAKKMAALIPITEELIEDSAIEVANLLANLIAEGFAEKEEYLVFCGDDATDPFDGLLNVDDTNIVTMDGGDDSFLDITYEYLRKMQNPLTKAARRGAKYYLNSTVMNHLAQLKDDAGNYIVNPGQDGLPKTLCGYDYELIDSMPDLADDDADTPFVAFGNLRHVYFGDRRKLMIKSSEHVAFADDVTFLKGTQRISIKVAIPSAYSILKTAA